MLSLSFNILWNINFFFIYFYLITVLSVVLFLIPSVKTLVGFVKFKKGNTFEYITGLDINLLIFSFLFGFLALLLSWSGPTVSSWFGHLVFSSFQYKITYLIIFFFSLIVNINCNSFYFSSKEVYDYVIVNLSLFLWTVFLFYSNTIFTVIFFIEILSSLIFLLLVTSTFSSTYYYNNLNLNLHHYFNNTVPFFFLQTLLYFFWISLLSSLNLFFSLLIFYINFFTFDWYFLEHIFIFLISIVQTKNIFFFLFAWFNFLFCFFLKCGLVPFFFWKPTFFKGIPLNAFFFYITFFYFFIFLFFIVFFLIYLTEIFYYFLIINILMLLIGFFVLLFILIESFYLKTFLALSSILNTFFIFLVLNGSNVFDFFLLF